MLAASLAPVFSVTAAVLHARDAAPGTWLPVTALAAVCLLAWLTHYSAVRTTAFWIFHPVTLWCLVLAASPVLAWYATRDVTRGTSTLGVAAEFECAPVPIEGERFVTDQGRPIPVFNYAAEQSAEDFEETFLAGMNYDWHIIRTAEPDLSYNCHGWVFTGGRFGLQSSDIETILQDNHYREVASPEPDDLIVYRNATDRIVHSGVVRSVLSHGTTVLIESKWGPLGRFLHTPDVQPYGLHYHYYRSPRPGHLLGTSPNPPAGFIATP